MHPIFLPFMAQKFPLLELPIFEDYYGESHRDSYPVQDAKVHNLKSNIKQKSTKGVYTHHNQVHPRNPHTIWEIEQNAFPELLTTEESKKEYMNCRNAIIELYQKSPSNRISISDAKKICNCDVATLMKIFALLEMHELINYKIDEFNCIEKARNIEEEDSPSDIQNKHCDRCKCGSMMDLYMSKIDFVLVCNNCRENGLFDSTSTYSDFVRYEKSHIDNTWTKQQEMILLDLIDDNYDWNHIANELGRTPEQCIIRFLSLNAKEEFVDEEYKNFAFDSINHLPNPVMSLIALTCGSVSPKIANIIAKWVLENIECRNMVNNDLIELCKKAATELRDKEETRLLTLQRSLVELQKSKLELKLNEYEELIGFVEKERNDYEYARKTCIKECNITRKNYK